MIRERTIGLAGMPGVIIPSTERPFIPEEVLEQQMHEEVLRRIHLPNCSQNELPTIIILAGPCRTATGALATALNRSERVRATHIQPYKTGRRNLYQSLLTGSEIKYERLDLYLAAGPHIEIIKETIGPRTQAEFFDPLIPLLDKGYPSEKLIFMPTSRDPLATFTSTVRMWDRDYVSIENLNRSYHLTAQTIETAKTYGIPVVPYVHELLRDYPPTQVMAGLTARLGIPYQDCLIYWDDDPAYENTITYEIPPRQFISGSISKSQGGRGGLLWKPCPQSLPPGEQERLRVNLSPSFEIYRRLHDQSREMIASAQNWENEKK
jgi:hypothetical protein